MSEPLNSVDTELPKTPVLSYITDISTPTRVRIIAYRAVLALAWVNLLLAAAVIVFVEIEAYRNARGRAGAIIWHAGGIRRPGPVTWKDVAEMSWEFMNRNPWVLLALGWMLVPGVLQLIFAGSVRRGRKWGSRLMFATLVPLQIGLVYVAVGVGGLAIVTGFGNGRGGAGDPKELFRLVLVLAMVPIILLVKDLGSFLKWIARNPVFEKPAVAFVSGRAKT